MSILMQNLLFLLMLRIGTALFLIKFSSLHADQEEDDQDLLHVYKIVFHGFATMLSSSLAFEMQSEVLNVIPDTMRQLHTTRSPQFLGLTSTRQDGLLEESDYGSNVIIEIIDTGIWPKRRSFHDQELGPVPTSWKDECVEGNGFNKSNCNKKVIGTRYFLTGMKRHTAQLMGPISDPQGHGHGTHTASIVAGRVVNGASMLGLASGMTTGIAPKARIAAYKACWPGGYFTSDILAGMDSVVADDIDIILISIGTHGGVEYNVDPIAIGTLGRRSVESALCMDGAVGGRIVFSEDGGIPRVTKREVVKKTGGAEMILANSSPNNEGPIGDAHVLPTIAIGETTGYDLHHYIATSVDPRCISTFYRAQLNVKPAPVVAPFSSRGPNLVSPYIIKPNIIVPGVEILVAWTDSVGPSGDLRRTDFNIMSYTSMSGPHVSGIAALLCGAHPHWSPAAVRSALMMTAYVHDNMGTRTIDATTGNASTVWDVGSRHMDPEKAVDPGLVYDLTVEDYLRFLYDSNYTEDNIRSISHRVVSCGGNGTRPWDLDYPSISVVFDELTAGWKEIEVRRSVMNVGDGAVVYEVKVKSPDGTSVVVDPTRLEFGGKGDKKSFVVRISAIEVKQIAGSLRSEFGVRTWTDGRRKRIPCLDQTGDLVLMGDTWSGAKLV